MRNGFFESFDNNGLPSKRGYYDNNKATGEWTFFNIYGGVFSIGNFINGIPNGDWTFYWDNGNILCKGKLVDGTPEGDWSYYDKDGNLKFNESSYGDF